jgi:hypothetical protein
LRTLASLNEAAVAQRLLGTETMTQLDPRSPTTRPATPGAQPPVKQEPPFNWRVSVGMAIGLVVLFGALFGLRTLGIFPPRPAEDPEIAAVRATLAALPTQPVAAVQPTAAPTPRSAATLGPVVPATPPPDAATVTRAATVAPTPVAAEQLVSTPQHEAASDDTAQANLVPANPTIGTSDEPQAPESTPVAVNLPADLSQAILQAYSNYWTVRLNAMRDPSDASIDLASVMGSTELAGAQQTIANFKNEGKAGYSTVHHTIWITNASADSAVIVDRYTATTTPIDPSTQEPTGADPVVEQYSDRFFLSNVDDQWKVVREEPER